MGYFPRTNLAPPTAPSTADSRRWPRPPSRLSPAALRWAVSCFCAIVGALMLVVPHQFSSPAFDQIRPLLPWVGGVYLAAGLVLLLATALRVRRALLLLCHIGVGAALLFYGAVLLAAGAWGAWPIYLTLGLGVLASGLLPHDQPARPDAEGDLLALLIGLSALNNGLVMLLLPEQFRLPIYDQVRPLLGGFGPTLALSGAAVVLAQLWAGLPRWANHASRLALAAAFLFYMSLVSLPTRGITGILFYGGFGILTALLPWLSRFLRALDPDALRLRLGLAFSAVAVLPLTLTVALITTQQERLVLEQSLNHQQTLAVTHAHDVANYISLHRDALALLAAQPDLLSRADRGRSALEQVRRLYPALQGCVAVGPEGAVLAASGEMPPGALSSQRAPDAPADPLQSGLVVLRAPAGASGGVACALSVAQLSTLSIDQPNQSRSVVIISQGGQVILSSEKPPALPALPADAAQRSGSLLLSQPSASLIVGYAPVKGLGWQVLIERPVMSALSSAYRARETAFGLLLAAVAAGMAVGGLLARRLTAPLHTLARAADRLAEGDPSAPLPSTRLTEVAHLSASFDHMRQQVTRAAETREEAIRMRDMFFSVAAHELKTPLTSLLGQAQLLQRRASRDSRLDPRDQRTLALVIAQTQRLSALVNALLDVSRLQQGRLSMEPSAFDLRELVRRVVEELQPTLERHTLQVEEERAPLPVQGDSLRLEQVLHNLIGNAVKYSPGGGAIAIRVARAEGAACVSVTDSGIGIPAEAIPNLFTQFYRAPNAEREHIGGMGIGLYVVREIMARHQGWISVESRERQGSTFVIGLPLCEEGQQQPCAAPPPAAGRGWAEEVAGSHIPKDRSRGEG
jgi:signal transduction histidine kinase